MGGPDTGVEGTRVWWVSILNESPDKTGIPKMRTLLCDGWCCYKWGLRWTTPTGPRGGGAARSQEDVCRTVSEIWVYLMLHSTRVQRFSTCSDWCTAFFSSLTVVAYSKKRLLAAPIFLLAGMCGGGGGGWGRGEDGYGKGTGMVSFYMWAGKREKASAAAMGLPGCGALRAPHPGNAGGYGGGGSGTVCEEM
ncbi:uncharacterized protein Ecym_3536 [Eremothecium cymbalariae DBVPG|uniref:Uncharacterized protein n=1 Tax=Eremothecium cymbalariae (strain CBS 270.75 / DBVPG 7215 / KCTC 17166 / NRRL Y-17582) TaxID=931890 RepID=G8JQM9_ERECY|nr:Hypothetical protein Ecym_3536 [Eremothecium cymbalariae DBVPG\